MKIKTSMNALEAQTEENTGLSLTVPDQSMEPTEILRRFAAGLPISGQRVTFYDEGQDLFDGVDPRKFDLAEIEQMKIASQLVIDENNARIKKLKQAQNQKQMQERIRKEIELKNQATSIKDDSSITA